MTDLKEYRVFGPPGTGKTTYVANQVDKAARALGSDALLVASFTRTAASELASRKMPLGKSQVGTLHSFAYRALKHPEIAQGMIAEWNKRRPHLRLSGGDQDLDHAAVDQTGASEGDNLLNQLDIYRGRMVPREQWPAAVQAFEKVWTEWKSEAGCLDFTDLIERCIEDGDPAPGRPRIAFFDEVQDFTPLELALVRQWGTHMDRIMLAGDDDQAIFTFKGATPDAFLDPQLPDGQVRVLGQSYRVPARVHTMAQTWVKQLSRRQEKEYLPRDAEGRIDSLRATWRAPENALADAEKRIDAGQTVMFLTTCSYMLDPVKALLRKRGLPFWNPYRTSRGDWNPLVRRDDVVTATDRLLSYLRPQEEVLGEDARLWSWEDVGRWMGPMQSKGVLKRGAKTWLNGITNDPDNAWRDADLADLADILVEEEAMGSAFAGDIDWWEARLLARQKGPLQFPIQVLRQHGAQALLEDPRITIGTVHSVKGGQADVVYLFPDLSPAGMREWLGRPAQRDGIIRQMYVGLTRAREHLVLCAPASRNHVDMRRFAGEGGR